MAIINRTVPLEVTGGGTASATGRNTSWVKLTNNRMVVVYSQNNPFARRFLIIDNPDGLTSTTEPTNTMVTAVGENTTSDYINATFVRMERLNDNAFVVIRKLPTTASQLPVNTFSTTVGIPSDMVPLPNDRIAVLSGSKDTMTFYGMDYTAKTFTNLGSANFTTASSDTNGRIVMPLNKDYVIILQRKPIFDGTAPRIKIVRLFDQNFIEQSAASALNSNAGFTTLTVPTTRTTLSHSYPEMLNGKVVWYGLNAAGTHFSWSIIDPGTL